MPQVKTLTGTPGEVEVLPSGTGSWRVALSAAVREKLSGLKGSSGGEVVNPGVVPSVPTQVDNKLWISGVDPNVSSGNVGDAWLNTVTLTIFGLKGDYGWGAGVSLFPIGRHLAQALVKIPSGASGGAVSGLGLPFTPLVVPTVIIPASGTPLTANVIAGTESSNGFQYVLSGSTDSENYLLGCLLVPKPDVVMVGSALTGAGEDPVTGAGGDDVAGAGES